MRTSTRRLAIIGASITSIVLAGCGPSPGASSDTPGASLSESPQELVSLPLQLAPTQGLPALVADGEGFFESAGIDAEVSIVEEDVPAFIAGQTNVASIAAWEVAQFINEGEEMVIFGTAGQPAYFNGVAVLADSSNSHISDLVGSKLGIPGFGSGTWAAFEGFMASKFDINAREDFQVVEASPGVLLGLLESGEIDGALLFSGQTLAAAGSGTFKLVFRFDEEWQNITEQPLSIGTLVARPSWLAENEAVAEGVVDALSAAVEWMQENPEEFDVGGKYEAAAADLGWHSDPETTSAVLDFLQSGSYFQTQAVYTRAYIDATYEFVQIVVDDPPTRDTLFSEALVSD